MSDDPPFVCAVCERKIDMRWNRRNSPDRMIPPICRSCEIFYTRAQDWGSKGVRAPQAGAFMDRRKALQIFVLAEALHTEVARQKWRSHHARA